MYNNLEFDGVGFDVEENLKFDYWFLRILMEIY